MRTIAIVTLALMLAAGPAMARCQVSVPFDLHYIGSESGCARPYLDPAPCYAGEIITYNVYPDYAFVDCDGGGATYRFSDGITLRGRNVTRRFLAPGRYYVQVSVFTNGSDKFSMGITQQIHIIQNPNPEPEPTKRRSVRH
jgi:hypothetical protein